MICATSSYASIVIENTSYSEVSIKFIDRLGKWVDSSVEARSFKTFNMKSTMIKIDTDNVFVEYNISSGNVYRLFINKEENFWDLKKITNPEQLHDYVQRGMIKNRK
jgi:hypothetical protein